MLKLSFVLEAVDKATAVARRVNKVINSITAPARRVRKSIASLGRESGLQRLVTAAGGVRNQFGGLMRDLRGLRTGLFLVTTAVVAMAYPLHRTIDQFSEVNDIAASFGISARDLQRLTAALTLDGSSIRDAAQSLKFLQQNAVAALSGSEEMATWFRRAGISADFLRKNLKDPKALLYALADGLKRNETPAKRIAILNALIGKSSARVAQTLSRGADELTRLGDEAESLGQILDDKTVGAMDDAGDSITRMQRTLGGLLATVTAAGLPVIQEIARGVIGWVQANRALIATRAQQFFQELLVRLPAIWDGLKEVGAATLAVARAINTVAQLMGGWQNVIYLVAGVLAAKLVVSIALVTKAVIGFGIALLTTPIGWFLAGIAAIAGAAYLIIKHWEPIKTFFKDLWKLVEDVILRIDSITPSWAKPLTLHGQWADSIRSSRAPAPVLGGSQQTSVGGLLRIHIDSEGRPRVRQLESENSDVPIEVSFGPVTAVPR